MADYSFNGIGHIEAQDRDNEHRTGVPSSGAGTALLSAPARRTSAVKAVNAGEEAAEIRLKAQGATKTQTTERLTAFARSSTHYAGKLQFKSITPGTVSIANAGAPDTLVDDGEGNLVEALTPTTVRGTIDYDTGLIDFTYGAAATEPVTATYDHTDFYDFQSSNQTTVKATGAVTPSPTVPFTVQLGIGRTVPGSVTVADAAALRFADDGKGNLIETTAGQDAVVGTIDYALGYLSFTDASAALTGNMTVTYKYNPFAVLLNKGGGARILDLHGGLPESNGEPWADGLKGSSKVGLWGVSRSATPTNLVTMWTHFGEEPYRVEEIFSGFPAGGYDNDPAIDHAVNHA